MPFTPVTGPRLLVRAGPAGRARGAPAPGRGDANRPARRLLAARHLPTARNGTCGRAGFLPRTDQQFHWRNEGYEASRISSAALASRKRKAIRNERARALEGGIEIEWVTGDDLTEAHWDAFFAFYMDTGSRKWGSPYLTRQFFSLLGAAHAR